MSTPSFCAPADSQALGFWRRPFVQDVLPLIAINTIAFFDRGAEYEELLKQIADDTKGNFRFVSEEDLTR